MIPDWKKCVFVLGAGASIPYGYPSGLELLQLIKGEDGIMEPSLLRGGHSKDHIQEFKQCLTDSLAPSIDFFLSKRPDFEKVGKHAIAIWLLRKEHQSIKRSLTPKEEAEMWYGNLVSLIDEKDFDAITFRNVKIVNFNYDKSLEHFLFRALRARHPGKSDMQVKGKIAELQIEHVYGTIGDLSWEAEGGRYYGKLDPNDFGENYSMIVKAADGLKVISEHRNDPGDSERLNRIRGWIRGAARVFFLVFSYQQENMELLGFPFSDGKTRSVIDTTYGMTPAEVYKVSHSLGIGELGNPSFRISSYLRNTESLLTLGDND